MNDEEKRQLAEMIAPHLAWDLSRSRIFEFAPNPHVTATAVQLQLDQLRTLVLASLERGEALKVAVIPLRQDD